jgi:predicted nuclease of predicted toxin-antitoxin system
MSIRLYMDEHVPRAITEGLRTRGVDVLTAQDDGATGSEDPMLLDRATALGRVLVTADQDFEVESARRQKAAIRFSGIIFLRLQSMTPGRCIDELELITVAMESDELTSLLKYVPI